MPILCPFCVSNVPVKALEASEDLCSSSYELLRCECVLFGVYCSSELLVEEKELDVNELASSSSSIPLLGIGDIGLFMVSILVSKNEKGSSV